MVGIAASGASTSTILTAGLAGLAAGSMAMAAGEYVSVSSQVDVEKADRAMEERELATNPEAELRKLAGIYESRGLPTALTQQVAEALHESGRWRRICARRTRSRRDHGSAPAAGVGRLGGSFLVGGLIPFLGLLGPTSGTRIWLVVAVTFVGLACAGILGTKAAGTTVARPALRVVIGGGLAMAITGAVGQLAHVSGI